jgi:hypothetical protein
MKFAFVITLFAPLYNHVEYQRIWLWTERTRRLRHCLPKKKEIFEVKYGKGSGLGYGCVD